jgi:predicted nucleotidyltransferase
MSPTPIPPLELSPAQRTLVEDLARRLAAIPGVAAVVLGGSYARGAARAGAALDRGRF